MSSSVRVLHVEDDPGFAELTADYLERHAAQLDVDHVTRAEQVLERLDRGRYECLVSDYDLPDRDGLDLLEQVRERWEDLPVILFTGKGSEDVASEAIAAGVTDYLQKDGGSEQFDLLATRIENAVDKQRARTNYRELFEKTSVGLAVLDPENASFLEVNQNFAELVARDREGLVGASVEILSSGDPPFTVGTVQSLVREALSAGTCTVEWLHRTPTGAEQWVEMTLTRSTIDGDDRLLTVVQDISDRKKRELELEEIERRYTAILNDPNILVGVLDLDGVLQKVNDTALEYIDRSREAVLGCPFEETPWFEEEPDIKSRIRDAYEEAASGQYVPFELELPRANEPSPTVSGTFRPVIDSEGTVQSVIVSAKDVTDRKRRKRELEQRTTELEGILDTIEASVWVRDTDSQYRWMNDSYREEFDLGDVPITGKTPTEVLGPEIGEKFEAADQRVLRTEESFQTEERYDTPTGERITLSEVAPVFDEEGRIQLICGVATDITDRKQREQRLRRYQEAIEASGHAIAILDEDATVTVANEAYEELTGEDPEASEESIPRILGEDPDHLPTEDGVQDIWRGERRIETADGTERIVDQTIASVTNEGGELDGYVSITADITERKEREQEARERARRLELSLEAAEIGIWDWNVETERITIDARFAEMLGFSPEERELPADFWMEMRHEEDNERVINELNTHLEGETEYFNVSQRMQTQGGDWRWIRDVGQVIERNDDGTPLRAIGCVVDITAQKRREEDLTEALNRLEFVLDSTDTIVWELDLETGALEHFGPFEQIPVEGESDRNAEFEELISKFIHPEDQSGFRSSINELRSGSSTSVDVDCRTHPDAGAVRWVHVRAFRADKDTVVGMATDITPIKEEEHRLREFTHVLAHDLRSPLTVAKGRLELFDEAVDDGTHFDTVQDALDRMETTIQKTLTLIRQGQRVGEAKPTSLEGVIKHCWDLVATPEASLEIQVQGEILADRERLTHVFENLFRNAIEHAGPAVNVRVGWLGDRSGVFIEDDGPGIPSEKREQLFAPDRSTARVGEGLGLAIVRSIVEAHEWEIRAESGERGGARFEIIGVTVSKANT